MVIVSKKPDLHLVLPLKNDSSNVIKLWLEPSCEYFSVESGQNVTVHALLRKLDEDAKQYSFTIAPNDSCFVIYAPGDLSEFVECYVVADNGIRLTPD